MCPEITIEKERVSYYQTWTTLVIYRLECICVRLSLSGLSFINEMSDLAPAKSPRRQC